jgi:t-SNARE complex subunit (syntaxin)
MRWDRNSYHGEARQAEAGFQRQQDEITQREGVITKLTDLVDKMRGDSIRTYAC